MDKGRRAVAKQGNTASTQVGSNQDNTFCQQIEACPIIQEMMEAIDNMVAGSADWSDIQNKPQNFPPSVHSHAWNEITSKPTEFVPSAHVHTIPDVTGLTSALASLASTDDLNAAIADLKDGVPTAGDSLQKLYNLVITSQDQFTVPDSAALAAFNVLNLNIQIFVVDDGDGNWALYKPTSTGIDANFIKISDPDLLNAVLSATAIKTAYESNPNTNAFTNALKSKLDSFTAIFTTGLKDAYDTAATWVSANSAAIAELLSNTSGSNTGDETTGTIQNKRPLKTVNGQSLEGAGNLAVAAAQAIRVTFSFHSIVGSTTNFLTTLGGVDTTETNCQWAAEHAFTATEIIIRTRSAWPANANCIYTVRKNGLDTPLTLTIPPNSPPNVYKVTGSVPFAVGDLFSFKRQNTLAGTSGHHSQLSVLIQ